MEATEEQKLVSVDESTHEATDCDSKELIDPYAYTKTDSFTSEVFKVEIQNLPKFFGIKQLKKKLGHINVKPCKVKMPERASYAFVNFRSEEEREAALKAIEGQVWKNKTVTAKKARPAADPALLKRKQEAEKDTAGVSNKRSKQEVDTRTPEERLKDAVTPLWRMDYKDQLAQKEKAVRDFLTSLGKEMEKNNQNLRQRHAQQRKLHGCCCEVVPIKQSPVLKQYRNKCEFTIGQTVDGIDKAIGFRLGSYKEGKVHVASPSDCDIAATDMIKAAQPLEDIAKLIYFSSVSVNVSTGCLRWILCVEIFGVNAFRGKLHQLGSPNLQDILELLEGFCREVSELPGFDPVKKCGAWRQLTVRTSLEGGVMVVLVLYKEGVTQEAVNKEREKLKQYIETKNIGQIFTKVSLYLEVVGDDR